MLDLLLKDARLPDGRILDISISRGRIVHCGASTGHAHAVIECRNRLCLPGAIDMHVHMRGGAQAEKEDWETGTRSAIAGGVTLVVDQPNTMPPIVSARRLMERISEAKAHAYCHFAINAGIAPEAEMAAMWEAGAMAFGEIFVSPSSYGEPTTEEGLRQALSCARRLGALATVHAERLLGRGASTLQEHDRTRPEEGEMEAVISVSKIGGERLHFCHMSSAGAIDCAKGSVEVAPHHLFLSHEMFDAGDARVKVNPPLRSRAVQRGLWNRWDRIDAIASDHAPHTLKDKSAPFEEAPAGIPGVETSIPLLLLSALRGEIAVESLLRKTVVNPARILGIEPPKLETGGRADLALYSMEPRRIRAEELHSRAGWTPYEGMEGIFPELVILEGECVYRDGEFSRCEPRWFPGRGYIDRR